MERFSVINNISKEDYKKLILKRAYRKPAVIFVTLVGLAMLLVVVLGMSGIIPVSEASQPPIMQIVIALLAFAMPLITMRSAAKNYDNSPIMHGDVRYTFSDEEITSVSPNIDASYKWESIIKTEDVAGYLLLYIGAMNAIILRKDIFTHDQLQEINRKVAR
jgi:hypothetical protein